ncbi:MAG: ABC transporter permease [Defluviicoccus sp.]|nr:ABC transporter permease [Defluviicoccus sp.]
MEDFLFDLIDLVQSIADGLLFGTTYAMIGIGFTLIFGVMDKLNMSYAAAAIAGAYSSIAAFALVPLPAPVVFLVAAFSAGIFGYLIYLLCFRFIPLASPLATLMATVGMLLLIDEIVVHETDGMPQPYPALFDDVMIEIGPFGLRGDLMFVFAVSVVAMGLLLYLIYRTRLGIATRAVSQQPVAAQLCGIGLERTNAMTFVITGVLGGVAGAMIGAAVGVLSPLLTLPFTVKGLIVTVIGGLGSIPGAIVAGLLVGAFENMFQFLRGVTERDMYVMDFYLGLLQIIGVHTILGLSAYVVMLTGQLSLAQAGFFAIGAYVSGMLTVLAGFHILPAMLVGGLLAGVMACIVGFPALRVKGLMLVIATLAFGEFVRLFFFNFDYQISKGGIAVGPLGGEGFRQIRFFPENGWTSLDVMLFVWGVVIAVMAALWWMDRSRAGAVLRAVGEDELAAQSAGINLTVVKVAAMTAGGFIAGLGGALYAHYTTHIEHLNFGVILATFAIAYPILGGLSNVFGTLIAVIFIQGVLVEGLRFLGDWRNLLFGALIVLAMNVRPRGLLDERSMALLKGLFTGRDHART